MAVAFVFRAQNFAGFRLVLSEIVESDETAEPGHVVHKCVGGFAAVEFGCAVPGDAFESSGKFRLTECISRLKHFAVVQEDPAADGETLESRTLFFEFVGKPLADWKAIFGEANGRSHHVGKVHRAVSLQGKSKAGDGSRHGNRAIADNRGFFVELAVLADVHVARGFTRCYLAVIQERGLAVGKTDQHKSAAANVSGRRLDDRKRESRGDSRIHSISASLQYFDSGL